MNEVYYAIYISALAANVFPSVCVHDLIRPPEKVAAEPQIPRGRLDTQRSFSRKPVFLEGFPGGRMRRLIQD